jgi:hypothetical protein
MTGRVVGCLLVVDGHARGAGLVADGDGDDRDVGPQQLPRLRRDHREDEDDAGSPAARQVRRVRR